MTITRPTPQQALRLVRAAGFLPYKVPAGYGAHRWLLNKDGHCINLDKGSLCVFAEQLQPGQDRHLRWPEHSTDMFATGDAVRVRGQLRAGYVVRTTREIVRVRHGGGEQEYTPSALDKLPTPPRHQIVAPTIEQRGEMAAQRRWRMRGALDAATGLYALYVPDERRYAGFLAYDHTAIQAIEVSPTRRGAGRTLVTWMQWQSPALAATPVPDQGGAFWEAMGFAPETSSAGSWSAS